MRSALLGLLLLGCAPAQPATAPPLGEARKAPGKCSACHLAPREHGLAPSRWEEFQKNHRRRVHLTPAERETLYDFLIGGEMPPAPTP